MNVTLKKSIILIIVLFTLISCGESNKNSGSLKDEQEKKEVVTTQEAKTNGEKTESYEDKLKEKMNPIEEKINKIIESGENMLAATLDLEEIWKEEYKNVYGLVSSKLPDTEKKKFENEEKTWLAEEENKIKEKLLEDLEEGSRDYEMIFSSQKTEIIKERTLKLAKKYDELNK